MYGASLEGSARGAAVASGRDGVALEERSLFGSEVLGGHHSEKLTVEAEDRSPFGLAQADRILGQRLEHRLEIERGPANDLE